MQLEQNFVVAAPVDRAWEVLLDLERIVPCMPGATLTSYEGDEFTGNVRVKLGPMVMTFTGRGRFLERDATAHRVVVEASGRDTKGAGSASARVNASLRADGDVTAVTVLTDLTISGRVAQLGRGMIADVSARLLDEFTTCLAGQLAPAAAAPAAASAPAAAAPAGTAAGAATAAPSGDAAAPSTDGPVPSTDAAAALSTVAGENPPAASVGRPATAAAASPAAQPTSATDASAAGRRVPAPRGPAEPIDLLGVTGVRATARRLAPYAVTFLAGGLVGALLTAWLG